MIISVACLRGAGWVTAFWTIDQTLRRSPPPATKHGASQCLWCVSKPGAAPKALSGPGPALPKCCSSSSKRRGPALQPKQSNLLLESWARAEQQLGKVEGSNSRDALSSIKSYTQDVAGFWFWVRTVEPACMWHYWERLLDPTSGNIFYCCPALSAGPAPQAPLLRQAGSALPWLWSSVRGQDISQHLESRSHHLTGCLLDFTPFRRWT